jgi:hypothetical protein
VPLGSGVFGADGRYSVSVVVPDVRRAVGVRVRVAETAVTVAVQAEAGLVDVWGWYYLRDKVPVYSSDYVYVMSASVDATRYPASVVFDDYEVDAGFSQSRIWNLNRDCSTLEAVVGVDANAPSSAVAYDVRVQGDDSPKWDKTVTYQQPQRLSLDVSGVLRLQFDVTHRSYDSYPGNGVVFGDARVKCLPR